MMTKVKNEAPVARHLLLGMIGHTFDQNEKRGNVVKVTHPDLGRIAVLAGVVPAEKLHEQLPVGVTLIESKESSLGHFASVQLRGGYMGRTTVSMDPSMSDLARLDMYRGEADFRLAEILETGPYGHNYSAKAAEAVLQMSQMYFRKEDWV